MLSSATTFVLSVWLVVVVILFVTSFGLWIYAAYLHLTSRDIDGAILGYYIGLVLLLVAFAFTFGLAVAHAILRAV